MVIDNWIPPMEDEDLTVSEAEFDLILQEVSEDLKDN